MVHRDRHPEPVPGCFGCKVSRLGFQALRSRHGADPVQRVPVVADDGPRRGRETGHHDVHWDGRQDATVRAPTLTVQTTVRES